LTASATHSFAAGTSPLDSYTNISFGPTSITYTGTQNSGYTSSWGGEDGSDLGLIRPQHRFRLSKDR